METIPLLRQALDRERYAARAPRLDVRPLEGQHPARMTIRGAPALPRLNPLVLWLVPSAARILPAPRRGRA